MYAEEDIIEYNACDPKVTVDIAMLQNDAN